MEPAANDYQALIKAVWPDWELVREIGQGSFSIVYKARRQDLAGETFSAIKISPIPRSQSELDSLRSEGMTEEEAHSYLESIVKDFSREIRLMETVKGHGNIVYIEDYKIIRHPEITVWYILIRMELLTPLAQHIAQHPADENMILKLGKDLCRALSACADQKIVHRDIKPENIFISDTGAFKLGDFGVARKLENTTLGFTRAGALNYMAPELYLQTDDAVSFEDAEKVDVYSLGLVMYYLANRVRLPFLPTDKQILSPNERQAAFLRRIKGEALP
ncbi:MAG: serine/threonine-protein kinase, partial [Clostridia bacterium]|nr:serine/threonine-protein kinase [Clostridia bacterium]